ncbi:hypothetical protein PHYC_00217 [Phycisphaerales bacterium]|nr:hypothetical protein PHYC_00217 [Phycisphaerales bacterium]
MKNHPFGRSCLVLALFAASGAIAQTTTSGPVQVSGPTETGAEDAAEWMKRLAIDANSPAAKRYAEQQKARLAAEKSLRKIRAKHFGTIKNVQIRQEGIVQLREFTEPSLFSSMIRLFEREGADVRTALLDHFQDSGTPEGEAALAWMGVFDKDVELRNDATKRVKKLVADHGGVPNPVKYVVFEGLRSQDTDVVTSAARLGAGIDMMDSIPWMIARLITGQPIQTPQTQSIGIGSRDPDSALAWIMVGTQTAFVSDLTPVVGPSAVAFDPQLSVVNEGVILRVLDAVVVTYHVDIYNVLTDFTSRMYGQSTRGLGWNVPAWRQWYAKDFLPEMARRAEEQKAADAAKNTETK